MSLDELEWALKAQGFQHSVEPKNPKQLRSSISALPSKTSRIVKAGTGAYGLNPKLYDAGTSQRD
jgi:hypothetical protein